MNNYQSFIESKRVSFYDSGFDVSESSLNSSLFDFQKYIVKTALKKGKYAIFADCGLGKTLMQLEWSRHVATHTGRPVLILAPLAVTGQTIEEGAKFGIHAERIQSNVFGPHIYVANYENLDNVDCSQFSGIVLDESSILKNFTGKRRKQIIDSFSHTLFKLACTATPSPNDHMELGNHAEFLNVMSRNEMLAMFFVHDGGETSKWRLKGHAQDEFWRFVSTWAVMLASPADIGFDGSAFKLPPLHYFERRIETEKQQNGLLFNDAAVSATTFNKQLRITITPRMENVADLVNQSDEPFIVWVNRNDEAHDIKNRIPGSVEVHGSESPDLKEKKLLGFAHNEFRVLVTKKKIAQFGLNYQNCNNQVFASLDFSFEGLYQAIRRSYRFGQKRPVNIYIVTTDTMGNVLKAIEKKQKQFEEMQTKMAEYSHKYMEQKPFNRSNYSEDSHTDDSFTMYLGDCVQRIKDIPDNSVGFSVFSPPFSELYVYNDLAEDMGNSRDYEEFKEHFRFLIPELSRILMPGRNVAVHCMDLPIQKGKEGYIGLRDFSGYLIGLFQEFGFTYHSRVTIWKNPVTEMQRTKALGLLHKQIKKDAVMSRVGIPDYLLIFRNEGENEIPIIHQDKNPSAPDYLPVDLWQKYASPVWLDIDYGKTLNARAGRDENDEKHIAPLQLQTIERCIHLWSNEGETVFTPFAGIGSEVYQSVKMGRKGIGIELKKSYFDEAVKNCLRAKAEYAQDKMTLF